MNRPMFCNILSPKEIKKVEEYLESAKDQVVYIFYPDEVEEFEEWLKSKGYGIYE